MYVKIELIIEYLPNSAWHPMLDARRGKRSECLHILRAVSHMGICHTIIDARLA